MEEVIISANHPENTTMSQLDRYIERYGPQAGPKLYHALQSRAAYIGSSRRRGREIEALTGRPLRKRSPAKPRPTIEVEVRPEPVVAEPRPEAPTLFPMDAVLVES
jgi:hypothetical protein